MNSFRKLGLIDYRAGDALHVHSSFLNIVLHDWNFIPKNAAIMFSRVQRFWELCLGILLCRCLHQPLRSDLLIHGYSVALSIAQAKVVLGSGIALICRFSNPLSGFYAVLQIPNGQSFVGRSQ